ncbi:MAG: UDP-N-acetylglucosamine 1-carboxyvinyltransferase [Oscillospiraceae bacterium]|nr:UDP-N-acetylglucosamine 1-carboxyvinyltransferase [Oscillospiraceae bacterium]
MARFIIEGGRALKGEIRAQGAKNSALPILTASLLCSGKVVIHNCPNLSDVRAVFKILRHLGASVEFSDSTAVIDTAGVNRYDIPDDLMREMRSSALFLGALAGRMGKAVMSFPGGCELGPRPIDLHTSALCRLGFSICEEYGELKLERSSMRAATIDLGFPSVGATENILLAAAISEGETIITGSAREPEIIDLAAFLNSAGADIKGAGESTILIKGVKRLYGTEYGVMSDRIETATYMSFAGLTGGEIFIKGADPSALSAVIPVVEAAGPRVYPVPGGIYINGRGTIYSVPPIRTMPYPGFPTDAQAPIMAMLSIARGTTIFIENIFESRYKHVDELNRMGADIRTEGRTAVVSGVPKLYGAKVVAKDLRGGAALVGAALCAEGRSEIKGICHIDRGYQSLDTTLKSLGADIIRK